MDLYQQLSCDLSDLEDRFLLLSSQLESYGLTVSDVLIADQRGGLVEIAKRTGRPLGETRDFVSYLKARIDVPPQKSLPHLDYIPTGLPELDRALSSGIPLGHITEIFGASGCGKSQLLIQIAIQAQMADISKHCIYISTEAGLETKRLLQMMSYFKSNCPSLLMDKIDYIYCDDLESQDHIFNTQLPIKLAQNTEKYNLLIIDSIGNHLRSNEVRSNNGELMQKIKEQEEEMGNTFQFNQIKSNNDKQLKHFFNAHSDYQSRIQKKHYLLNLHASLMQIAQSHNLAVVVANQVADQPVEENGKFNDGTFDSLNFNYQLGQFSGWDEVTLYNYQRQLLGTLILSELVPLPSKKGNERENTYDHHNLTMESLVKSYNNKETRRIIASLGYPWAKRMTCKILLLKVYKPVFNGSDADVLASVNADPGLAYEELISGFTKSLQTASEYKIGDKRAHQDEPKSLASLIDGWKVERHIKIVSLPFSTASSSYKRAKISFAITDECLTS